MGTQLGTSHPNFFFQGVPQRPETFPWGPLNRVAGAVADLQGDPIFVDGHLGGHLVGVRGGPQLRLADGYHWGRQRVLDDLGGWILIFHSLW